MTDIERPTCESCPYWQAPARSDPFDGLTYREREIVKMRDGLGDDGESYTVAEVAHIFSVTIGRIRSLEKSARAKMADATLVGSCHRYPTTIQKAADDWCGCHPKFPEYQDALRIAAREAST